MSGQPNRLEDPHPEVRREAAFVLGNYTGRHKETGKSMRAATAHVFDIRNGRIRRFRQYTDTAIIRDATM